MNNEAGKTDEPDLRTWIVDDHSAIRELLVDFIGRAPGYKVVGSGPLAESALAAAREGAVDFIVLDLLLPKQTGLHALEELSQLPNKPRVMIFSAVTTVQTIEMCVQLGAVGYVEKNSPLKQMEAALARIRQGGVYFSEGASRVLGQLLHRKSTSNAKKDVPNQRQLELVRMLAVGKTMKEIASEMNLSEQYLYRLRQELFKEWEVRTDQQMVVRALQMGLLGLDSLGDTALPIAPPSGQT